MNFQFQVPSLKFPSMKSMDLDRCRSWKKPLIVLATGFGLGCSPVASGTAGTVPGVLISLGLASFTLTCQITAAILLILLAVWLCDVAEKHFGTKDDPRIVADEFLTFPICMLGLPSHAWVLCMAFLTHRVMDIIKPPPARTLQKLHGGIGITIDDTISSIYSLLINHVIYRLIVSWL
ncbi:phosphatidylglycerophosphatase A [Verrucomicrobiota bacterium]